MTLPLRLLLLVLGAAGSYSSGVNRTVHRYCTPPPPAHTHTRLSSPQKAKKGSPSPGCAAAAGGGGGVVCSSVRLKNDGGTACFNVPYGAKVLSYDTQPLHSSSAAQGAKGFHVVSYGPPPLSTPTTTGACFGCGAWHRRRAYHPHAHPPPNKPCHVGGYIWLPVRLTNTRMLTNALVCVACVACVCVVCVGGLQARRTDS